MSRAQIDASLAAVADTEAAHALDLVRTAFEEHAGQVARESKLRYANLHHATIDFQHLLSIRAYEQEAALDVKLHMTQLEQSERQADQAVELRIAAEQEQFACVRRMAKLDELRRETNAQAKVADTRLERSKEDETSTHRRQS
ncbi:MAG: hypothetical protein ACRYG8_06955 [Janthinobacterium lividum]